MKINFTKMHGIGNDYIYINCMKSEIQNVEELAIKLSDRHFGIGSDGLVLIYKSSIADCKMRMFNSDGSEGKMCGNAIRCVAKYVYDNNIFKKSILNIETLSGVKEIYLNIENDLVCSAKVNMGIPELFANKIPVNIKKDKVINYPLNIDNELYNITCVSMGNPHAVVFLNEITNLDLSKLGAKFENNSLFPERINTEFVKVIDRNTLEMRVWERGTGETLACGTGACATVIAAILNGYCSSNENIKVILKGGDIIINYSNGVVFMTGGCEKVFEGVIDI